MHATRCAGEGKAACERDADAEYTRLSQIQDNALATCDIRGDCAKLVRQVNDGKAAQAWLVSSGALPDNFIGAANLQQLGERLAGDPALREQVSKAITAHYICTTNPAKCTQQAAMVALGVGGLVAGGAVAVSVPALASAAGLAIEACVANVILCANRAGVALADVLAGDALGGASLSVGGAGVAVAGKRAAETVAVNEVRVSQVPSTAGLAIWDAGRGIRVYPDGSLRTPDGKFASLSGSPAPGTTAATNYADFLSRNGVNVVGQEMVVNGPLGPRRYDVIVQDATGALQGIEIKSGGATKNTYQEFTDMFVNRFGAPGAGRLTGKSVMSTITIYLP